MELVELLKTKINFNRENIFNENHIEQFDKIKKGEKLEMEKQINLKFDVNFFNLKINFLELYY